jgi:phosphate/sulfate permease
VTGPAPHFTPTDLPGPSPLPRAPLTPTSAHHHLGGAGAVVWNKRINEFPFISGVLAIVVSWFVSPLIAGLISATLFVILRLAVLRSKNSVTRAIWCLPILLMITVFVK